MLNHYQHPSSENFLSFKIICKILNLRMGKMENFTLHVFLPELKVNYFNAKN
jgi:hypothetical protein